MKKMFENFETRPIRLIALLFAIWLASLACDDGRATSPDLPHAQFPPCEADSLREVIGHLQFIIGQQAKMIRCLQDGGRPEDCYGGV